MKPIEDRTPINQPLCNYIGCRSPAVYRADYRSKSWPKPVLRCRAHTGHHDFTQRWVDGRWDAIETPKEERNDH